MNKQETKNAIEVMQAFVDGKQIESSKLGIHSWVPLGDCDPFWDWRNQEYRVGQNRVSLFDIALHIAKYAEKIVELCGAQVVVVGTVCDGTKGGTSILFRDASGRLFVSQDPAERIVVK